ncbi:hypothetical protein LZ30DRAFT_693586 [Colletotrichum cereale]|nr:hypothetical protein LZ30DRAFT_693586 [Colletotrichum cereale]
MHFSQLQAVAAIWAFLLPTHLLASLLFKDKPAECVVRDAPPSTDWSHSYYTFTLDPSGQQAAEANGATTIHLIQVCTPHENPWWPLFAGDYTINEGYIKLNGFGPDYPYTIQVPRCEKGYDRQPESYSIELCAGNAEVLNKHARGELLGLTRPVPLGELLTYQKALACMPLYFMDNVG